MASHSRSETGATLISSSPTTSKFEDTAPLSSAGSGIIPPTHPARTLVLCFDGTGDQFDADNSSVIEFFRLLKKDDRTQQMAGIGTYTAPQVATPLVAKFSKAVDDAIAWNLHAHVMAGYEFVMQNYMAGDRICIFGFSRGAYTARGLAGMIHKVGVLPSDNHQQVPFAYKMYTKADKVGWAQSNAFKKAFSIDVKIEYLGVWDTVSSVGIIPKRLPFTTSNTIIRTFRHAISLDERRAKFKQNCWNRPNAVEEKLGTHSTNRKLPTSVHRSGGKNSLKAFEREYSQDSPIETDVEEVWFAGCHCDVGGGSVANDTKPNLARIPLRWMIRECFKTNTGILFHSELLKDVGIDPDCLYPEVLDRPPPLPVEGHHIQHIPSSSALKAQAAAAASSDQQHQTEEEMELADALSPIYDQLSLKWVWWILEFWPIRMRRQLENNAWLSYLGWNLGRGRRVPRQHSDGVKVHRSVKMRLDARYPDGSKYVPRADLDERYITWVD
ncbi:hypothetical protein D9757_009235 [Collybiopsis confluens]|uniref:T6SS Phospholipase effector Tle1-like catalytic domain-containing protein n=1 Tax=Collybiopsis confluens TaxID=2823264 RepID=A0A8H5HAB4_9AGAR|nr:hypothetical protein D9757_009235 [Collybiopsis confluens]